MKTDAEMKIKKGDNKGQDDSAVNLLKRIKREKERLKEKKLLINYKEINSSNIEYRPFTIPRNWMWVRLGEVSIIQEGPGIRKYQYKKEGIQFLTVTNILEGEVDLEKSKKYISVEEFNGKYNHFKINKQDIVIACSGGSWGKSAIYNHDDTIILNTSTLRLRYFGDIGYNKYLYYMTKADFFKNQIKSQLTGQQPNFGYSHYSIIQVPLPPLSEQKQIVCILDEAFEEIATAKTNAEKNLQNARALFESHLQSVFTQRGDAWEEKMIGEVLQKTETVDPTKSPHKEFIYIDVSSVNKENLTIENSTLIKGKDAPSRARKFIRTNDVIFATVRPTLRRIAIIPEEFNGQVCSTGYFVLRTKEYLNNKFMFYFLRTNSFNEKMDKMQKGASYPAVTDSEVRRQIIPYPKSLIEQHAIVAKFDELSKETQRLEAIYQQKLDALEELKKSMLHQAFSGELKEKNYEQRRP